MAANAKEDGVNICLIENISQKIHAPGALGKEEVSGKRRNVVTSEVVPMRWLLLLFLAFLLSGATVAQQTTDVTDDLITRADLIIRATVQQEGTVVEGGTTYRLGLSLHGAYKGSEDLALWPMFVPNAQQRSFKVRDTRVFFLLVDIDGKRIILLDEPSAMQPGDITSATALSERIRAMSGITVKMTTSNPAYTSGEAVELVWKITNTSLTPVRIYTGPYAFQYDYVVDNTRTGPGSGGTHLRKEADYPLLNPGDTFENRQELRMFTQSRLPEIFSVGQVSVTMRYQGNGNWLGYEHNKTGRVDNVAILYQKTAFKVTITPPDAIAIAAMRRQLSSPRWHEQLQALRGLSGVPETAAFPEVKELANHSWSDIRKEAAVLLSLAPGPLTPELRQLIADPSFIVRDQACKFVRNRRITAATMTFYTFIAISNELFQQGYLPNVSSEVTGTEVTLNNSPDPRLGDIMASRVKAGKDSGQLLNRILPREQCLEVGAQSFTDEEKVTLLANWQNIRGTVEHLYTMQDFDAEMAYFHRQVFGNFVPDPHMKEIRELLRNAGSNLAADQKASAATLEGYGPGIAPTIQYILNNAYNSEYDSPALYNTMVKWKIQSATPLFIGRALNGSMDAALAAFVLDPAVAEEQLGGLIADNQGIAIAMVKQGHKSAVHFIIEKLGVFDSRWTREQESILKNVTGLNLAGIAAWKKWWDTTGKLEKWE